MQKNNPKRTRKRLFFGYITVPMNIGIHDTLTSLIDFSSFPVIIP
jgi:hypothetical protein